MSSAPWDRVKVTGTSHRGAAGRTDVGQRGGASGTPREGAEGAERTVRGKGDKHMDMLWKSESGAPEEEERGRDADVGEPVRSLKWKRPWQLEWCLGMEIRGKPLFILVRSMVLSLCSD